jgi:UDP-N-acetylglucosamine 2-epimerase (non-hydrolysing)
MAKRIVHVTGARPNFMKLSPVMKALSVYDDYKQILIHTGQHYDPELSSVFLKQLEIPKPNYHLGVGSGTHAQQTATILTNLEPILRNVEPKLLLVYGDVNSTLAASITAAKLQIPIAHVEAGLRSFDRSMPEEINRIITDSLADILFTTEESANENLKNEGKPDSSIHFVGNVMIDTLMQHLELARELDVPAKYNVNKKYYVIVTLHRPNNVDFAESLESIMVALNKINQKLPVIFPLHPRTQARLQQFDLEKYLKNLQVMIPLGYLEFLGLMESAAAVITDSGGIQEETTILKIPCITLRPNTERPITLDKGTNRLVSTDTSDIVRNVDDILASFKPPKELPPFWDGHAAERIAGIIDDWVKKHPVPR